MLFASIQAVPVHEGAVSHISIIHSVPSHAHGHHTYQAAAPVVAHVAAAPVVAHVPAAPVIHKAEFTPVHEVISEPVIHKIAVAPVIHKVAVAPVVTKIAAPVQQQHHHEAQHYAPAHYSFEYSVHDPHTHDIKEQKEHREGDSVKGMYSLIEPDGSKRVVEYTADKHNGFNAVVHRQHNTHPSHTEVAKIVAPIAVAAPTLDHHYHHHH